MRGKSNAVHVFYSYSHKDSRLRDKLESHLSLLRRDGLIAEWFDGKIKPGEEIDPKIDVNLARSEVVLLLISADFLNSEYCYETEMQKALSRHSEGTARVIPIIIRPIEDGWKGTIFATLKALPKDGKPVTSWRNRDEAWVSVANGVREAIIDLGRGNRVVTGRKKPKTRRRS
jgi:internalin A